MSHAELLSSRRPEIPWLPGISSEVNDIVEMLKKVQEKCPGRFHLVMETETVSGMLRTASADTRILFSPTISFESDHPEKVLKSQELVVALRSLSVMTECSMASSRVQVPSRHRTSAQVPVNESLRGIIDSIPSWFPGSAYKKAALDDETWTKMKQEKLQVEEVHADRFSALPVRALRDMYQLFFTNFQARIRKCDPSLVRNKLEYSRFTPPWIRQQLCVGKRQVCYLSKINSETLSLPDLRAQRNASGYQRMAIILAAFYQLEPSLRTMMDAIISQVSERGQVSPQARSKRRLSSTGVGRIPKKASRAVQSSPQNEIGGTGTEMPPKETGGTGSSGARACTATGPIIHNGNQIFCAFGLSCLLKDLPQDPQRITAKCRQCDIAKMHDLCGGGEDGERICPRCQSN